MEKTFSKIEINTIKSIAKNVAPYVAKKEKLDAQIKEVEEKVAEQIRKRAQEKIEKLEIEKKAYQDIIDSMNETVKRMTGGYTTEDLIDSKKEATGSVDSKTGKEIFKTVYVLKYPETLIPLTSEETNSEEAEDNEALNNEAAQEEVIEEQVAEDAELQMSAEENADPFGVADAWG